MDEVVPLGAFLEEVVPEAEEAGGGGDDEGLQGGVERLDDEVGGEDRLELVELLLHL